MRSLVREGFRGHETVASRTGAQVRGTVDTSARTAHRDDWVRAWPLNKPALIVLANSAAVLVWRRWHDGVFLALAVILEASVFVIVSFIVDRDRPPVVQLDPPTPSGSFIVARAVLTAGIEKIDCDPADSFPERVRGLDLTTGANR